MQSRGLAFFSLNYVHWPHQSLLLDLEHITFSELGSLAEWDTPNSIRVNKLSQHLVNVARIVSAVVYEMSTNQPMSNSIQPNISLVICIHKYVYFTNLFTLQ